MKFNPGDKARKVGGTQATGTVISVGVAASGATLVAFQYDRTEDVIVVTEDKLAQGDAQLEPADAPVKRAYKRGAQPE